jgi:hypothetical protein
LRIVSFTWNHEVPRHEVAQQRVECIDRDLLLEDQVQRVAKMLGTRGSALRVWVLANRAAVIGS